MRSVGQSLMEVTVVVMDAPDELGAGGGLEQHPKGGGGWLNIERGEINYQGWY